MTAVITLLSLASCQKKDETPVDLSKVSVIFTSPVSGHTYHKGEVVVITADASYISEITGIGVQVIDTASGDVVFEADHDLHTDHYTLDESWENTLADSAVVEVKVFVFVANSTTAAERSVYFTSVP